MLFAWPQPHRTAMVAALAQLAAFHYLENQRALVRAASEVVNGGLRLHPNGPAHPRAAFMPPPHQDGEEQLLQHERFTLYGAWPLLEEALRNEMFGLVQSLDTCRHGEVFGYLVSLLQLLSQTMARADAYEGRYPLLRRKAQGQW